MNPHLLYISVQILYSEFTLHYQVLLQNMFHCLYSAPNQYIQAFLYSAASRDVYMRALVCVCVCDLRLVDDASPPLLPFELLSGLLQGSDGCGHAQAWLQGPLPLLLHLQNWAKGPLTGTGDKVNVLLPRPARLIIDEAPVDGQLDPRKPKSFHLRH